MDQGYLFSVELPSALAAQARLARLVRVLPKQFNFDQSVL